MATATMPMSTRAGHIANRNVSRKCAAEIDRDCEQEHEDKGDQRQFDECLALV
jgi:hypothetical protein